MILIVEKKVTEVDIVPKLVCKTSKVLQTFHARSQNGPAKSQKWQEYGFSSASQKRPEDLNAP